MTNAPAEEYLELAGGRVHLFRGRARRGGPTPRRFARAAQRGRLRLPEHPVTDLFLLPPAKLPGVLFHNPPPAPPEPVGAPDIDTIIAAYREAASLARFSWVPFLSNPKLERRLRRYTYMSVYAPVRVVRHWFDGYRQAAADLGYTSPGSLRSVLAAGLKGFAAPYEDIITNGQAVVGSSAAVAERPLGVAAS